MTKKVIEGICQTGGSIQAEQLAVGRQARAEKVVQAAAGVLAEKNLAEISEKLSELLEAIQANRERLTNFDNMMEATKLVAKGLAEPKPNKLTLTSLLEGVGKGANSVTSIIKAAGVLQSLIAGLL